LKTIRKVDPEAAQTVLSEEQKTREYNVARAEKVLDRIEDGEKKLGIDKLRISPEIKQLILEGTARRYTMETGGKTGNEYKKELYSEGVYILWDWLAEMIYKLPLSKDRNLRDSHDFIRLTVKDLGLEQGCTFEDIKKRAKKLMLGLCSPEDGLEFRLRGDVEREEYINKEETMIAMEPIVNSNNEAVLFASHYARKDDDFYNRFYPIEARGKPILKAYEAKTKEGYHAETDFLFRLIDKGERI